MSSSTKPAIQALAFLSYLLFPIASSTYCSRDFYKLAKHISPTGCKKLPTLGAEFGWNYVYSNNSLNETRFRMILGVKLDYEMGWLAWGVNPGKTPQMVGTRAIIGIRLQNESLVIKTYNITADTKLGCRIQPSEIDVNVSNMVVQYIKETSHLVIQAMVVLPKEYNISRLNHVWQVGGYHAKDVQPNYDEDEQPKKHAMLLQNVDSTETIDLKTGRSYDTKTHRRPLRTVHGVLNILGGGVLLPIGVLFARYLRTYTFGIKEDRWFNLHRFCQIAGSVLLAAGGSIGVSLGSSSKYYVFSTHRLLAIFILTFTGLQVLALRLIPKEYDEYRKPWNMYHHFLGYALLALISVNIFYGISILRPDNKRWKWAYIGILIAFGVIVLGLEVCNWTRFFEEKRKEKSGTEGKGPDKSPTVKSETEGKGPDEQIP